jgi:hypothetical protein
MRKVKYPFSKDKDWLNEHYIVKNMSIQKIADAESVPYHVIRGALIKAGITMKPQKIYGFVNHPNRKKENHPNWKGGLPNCEQCGKQVSFGRKKCIKCYGLSNRGENNPNWKEIKKTRETQIARGSPEYIEWRTKIFKSAGFKCSICGIKERTNVVHHLDGFNKFPEKRYNLDNGVVLCDKHHMSFHLNFGFGNNTKEQFDEFLLNIKEGEPCGS